MRANFRCVKEWQDSGYPLGSSSDTASKMFDAALTQLYGWYHDPQLDGIEGTLNRMNAADPNFILGKVLNINLCFGGRFAGRNAELRTKVQELREFAGKKDVLTDLERLHIEGIEHWTEGKLYQARSIWEKILLNYPNDRLALRLVFDTDFYLGDELHRCDTTRRAMSTVHDKDPLSGYLYGMYGFSLCETNACSEAEKVVRQGLDMMHGKDTWAVHSLMHVLDKNTRSKEGLEYYETNEKNWVLPGALTNHNYWHMALFHLDCCDLDAALEVYDQHILPRVTPQNFIAIGDASSFLYRVKMLGGDIEDRAEELFNRCEERMKDHSHFLQDIHLFLAAALAKNQSTMDFLNNMIEEFREGDNERYKDKGVLLKTIYKAIEYYSNEDYEAVIKLLSSVESAIVDIGGSQAQRDIFNLMFITAALNAPNHKLAKMLLHQRKEAKGDSPLMDNMMERCIVLHDS